MLEKMHQRWLQPFIVLAGAFIYAVGMNWFVIPFHLYSGGVLGIAQIIDLFLGKYIDLGAINLNGILYLVINIPLLFLAWRSIGGVFFFKTLLGAGAISLFMSVLPVPGVPILDERLASVLVGGIVSGFGIGIILFSRGSGGGLDIIGVWASRKYKNASVGKISLMLNGAIYLALLFLADLETVLYSLIYMVFFTMMLDRVHYQNINLRLMVFTKKEGVDQKIMRQTGRGVTEWRGIGAYSGEDTRVLVSCINKYEVGEIMDIIRGVDPDAFVIADEGVHVSGNFEKRI